MESGESWYIFSVLLPTLTLNINIGMIDHNHSIRDNTITNYAIILGTMGMGRCTWSIDIMEICEEHHIIYNAIRRHGQLDDPFRCSLTGFTISRLCMTKTTVPASSRLLSPICSQRNAYMEVPNNIVLV